MRNYAIFYTALAAVVAWAVYDQNPKDGHYETEAIEMRSFSRKTLKELEESSQLNVFESAKNGDLISLAAKRKNDQNWDLEKLNEDGRTVLHVAIEHGQSKTIDLLRGYGASPETRTSLGFMPLDLAAKLLQESEIKYGINSVRVHRSVEVFESLFKYKNLNIEHVIKGREVPLLTWLVLGTSSGAGVFEKLAKAKLDIGKGTSFYASVERAINYRNKVDGKTALHHAVRQTYEKINATLGCLPPAFHIASKPECRVYKLFHSMAKIGADPRVQDNEGKSALHAVFEETIDWRMSFQYNTRAVLVFAFQAFERAAIRETMSMKDNEGFVPKAIEACKGDRYCLMPVQLLDQWAGI